MARPPFCCEVFFSVIEFLCRSVRVSFRAKCRESGSSLPRRRRSPEPSPNLSREITGEGSEGSGLRIDTSGCFDAGDRAEARDGSGSARDCYCRRSDFSSAGALPGLARALDCERSARWERRRRRRGPREDFRAAHARVAMAAACVRMAQRWRSADSRRVVQPACLHARLSSGRRARARTRAGCGGG